MIPMRDGAHLQTVILTPANHRAAADPAPTHAVRRSAGPVPDRCRANLKELAHDGYIFVIQNLRGRFKSEGTFLLSSQVDLQRLAKSDERDDRRVRHASTGW